MTFPFRSSETGRICCSTPEAMCPRCAAKIAAARLAGEAVPPELLRAAKDAMQAHLNGGRISEADLQALEAEIRAASGDSFAAPDPYAAGIKKLQEASATPASKFEERYRAERQADTSRNMPDRRRCANGRHHHGHIES